jgi:hypothetical protein
VKVDRVACPWLIKRFIDPDAQFEFLGEDTDWSSVRGTEFFFDVPGCELGHHGDDVSFDSILKKHSSNDPPLRLADIVPAADSHRASPHVAGEGLRWIAHGFRKLGLSDHELLNREFILYDALHAECKERSASHESK